MAERKLKDWLKTYIEYASYSEAPVSFHFWSGVWAIAGALRRKVYFDQEYYIYTPNFYIILVAPPAIGTKSTAISIAARLLRDISGINFGPNAMTREALPVALDSAAESYEMEPGSFLPMSCLNFGVRELGTLLDVQDRKMLDWLTDLWDGQNIVWEKKTKTMGSESISNPWINIIAGTTPGWLADNVPRVIVGAGFMSRCVFVLETQKRKLIAYPRDFIPNGLILQMKDDLRHDLEIISLLKGEYILSPDAHAYGIEWYRSLYEKSSSRLTDRELTGYLGRKQGHVHKLAIVLTAAKSDERVIEEPDLRAAVQIMTSLEPDMPEIFKAVYTTETQARVERMLEIVKANGSIPRVSLYRQVMNCMSDKEFIEALDAGINAGLIEQTARGNTIFVEAIVESSEDTPSPSPEDSPSIPSQAEDQALDDSEYSDDDGSQNDIPGM